MVIVSCSVYENFDGKCAVCSVYNLNIEGFFEVVNKGNKVYIMFP